MYQLNLNRLMANKWVWLTFAGHFLIARHEPSSSKIFLFQLSQKYRRKEMYFPVFLIKIYKLRNWQNPKSYGKFKARDHIVGFLMAMRNQTLILTLNWGWGWTCQLYNFVICYLIITSLTGFVVVWFGSLCVCAFVCVCFFKIKMWCAGEIAEWVKCLLWKHEDPGSIPKAHVIMPNMKAYHYNLNPGEMETEDPGFTGQPA